MPDARAVLRRIVLILIAFLGCSESLAAGERVRFLEPTDGAMVVGPSTMRFEVTTLPPQVDRIDVFIEQVLIGTALPPTWTVEWPEERTLRGERIMAVGYAGETIVDQVGIQARNFGGVQHVQVELVQLYPVVRDPLNRYIRDLTKEDFIVLENGQEVPIKHCANEVNSLNIALLLDVSRSMHSKLGRVQDASIRFVDELEPEDALALYAFNHRVHRVAPITLDHATVQEKIWYLEASGGTALYDGLLEVVKDLSDVPGRKAVVIFSDGHDKLSLTSLARVVREATRGEVIVYAVGAGHAGTARDDLELLASQSGGRAFFIERPRQLAEVYEQIRQHLRSQYLLSYTPPGGPEEVREIEVKVRGRGYSVECRSSYHYIPRQSQ